MFIPADPPYVSPDVRNQDDARQALHGYAASLTVLYQAEEDIDQLTSADVVHLMDHLGIELSDFADPYTFDAARSEMLLSLEVNSETRRYRAIFCTGGPHYELTWLLDGPDGRTGDPHDAYFLSMPWFGRVELRGLDDVCTRFIAELAGSIIDMGGVRTVCGYDDDDWDESLYDDDDDDDDDDETEDDQAEAFDALLDTFEADLDAAIAQGARERGED